MFEAKALAGCLDCLSIQAWDDLDRLGPQAWLESLKVALAQAFGARCCDIVISDRDHKVGRVLALVQPRGSHSAPDLDTRPEPEVWSWMQRVFETRQSFWAPDVSDGLLARLIGQTSPHQAAGALLLLPLLSPDHVIGALSLTWDTARAPLTADEQVLAQGLGKLLVAVLNHLGLTDAPGGLLAPYRMVLNAIGEPALIIARNGDIRVANKAACALMHYPAETLERMSVYDVYTTLDPATLYQLSQAFKNEQRCCAIDLILNRQDGSTLPVGVTGYLVEVGNESLYMALHRDLADAQGVEAGLRKRLAQLETLHTFSAEMTAQWQADRLLQSITERTITLLDASVGGLYLYNAERDLLELRVVHQLDELNIAASLRPGEGAVGQAFITQGPINIPDYAAYPHAIPMLRHQIVSVLAAPLRWQERCLGVLMIADRSRARRFAADDEHLVSLVTHHAAIVLTQAQLFAELQATTDDLRRANVELLELDHMKDDLLATVTHELQQPLTNARLNIDVLLQRPEQFSEAQRTMLTRAIYYIDLQHRLISDLLYMISVDRIEPEERVPLDLRLIVRDVYATLRPEAEGKQLAFEIVLPDESVECLADPYSLQRALANIVGNAIKFTSEGQVRIVVSVDQAHGQALVYVQDSGIGIAPEHQQRLFQRFYQADGGSRRVFGGLGIGLATAQRIIKGHGGEIEVHSTPGVGSEFVVRLPLATGD